MATLVNLCLQNLIDLPYYRVHQEEVRLFVCAGELMDDRMNRLFASFDAYLTGKLNGLEPTKNQKLVLSYLIKSEWANNQMRHTILLTPDNNHYEELIGLEKVSLIQKHTESPSLYPIYIVDRELLKQDYLTELRVFFGATFDAADDFSKKVLGVVYRFNNYSRSRVVSAKQASFFLWAQDGGRADDIKAFDVFYRKVRTTFNKLEKADFLVKQPGGRGYGYLLNSSYKESHLG